MNRFPPNQIDSPTASKPTSALFLYAIILLIPLVLGAYWPAFMRRPFGTAEMLRPIVFSVSLVTCLLWGYLPLTSIEIRLAGMFSLFCTAWLASSLAATDPDRAMLDWLKLIVLCIISLFLSRVLRYRAASKAFGHGLIAASIVAGALIVVVYVRIAGLSIPTYESARRFKGLAGVLTGLSLNTIAFTSIFAYVSGMCLVRANKILWALGGVLLLIATVLTGSRAPLAVVLVAACIMALIHAVRSPQLPLRFLGFAALGMLALGLPILLYSVSFAQMSAVTEGRWDLWSVAWAKFTERPILGFGYESWHDDLAARLPGVYKTSKGLGNEVSGGYHNEYLTVLAEQGLLGMIPVIAICWFMIQSAWRLAFDKWITRPNGQWLLFATIFLLFRACVEVPGLFGYSQEPADFLAYIFLAIIVSRISIEQDRKSLAAQ